jgi:hypothetical protein
VKNTPGRPRPWRASTPAGGLQAGVDYLFEIPLKVAQGICGFKHDEDCRHLPADGFVVLSGFSPRKGLLRRIFG